MPVVWPTLLDLSRDECKRILRKLELEAYAGVISALRAQGDLTKEKKDLLGELSKVLSISTERHRAEVRRAVNDERLTTIAHKMNLSLYLGERPSYRYANRLLLFQAFSCIYFQIDALNYSGAHTPFMN